MNNLDPYSPNCGEPEKQDSGELSLSERVAKLEKELEAANNRVDELEQSLDDMTDQRDDLQLQLDDVATTNEEIERYQKHMEGERWALLRPKSGGPVSVCSFSAGKSDKQILEYVSQSLGWGKNIDEEIALVRVESTYALSNQFVKRK